MTTLASLLTDTAAKYPERTAIVIGDMRLSYAQLDQYSDFVAAALARRGIGPGDTVALTCPNLPYFTIAYYGILKAGAAVVPLNVMLKAREVAYHLNDSGAKAYFCFEGTEELPMGREGVLAFTEADACEHLFVITAELQGYSRFAGHRTMMQVMTEAVQEQAPVPAPAITDEDTAVILYTSGTTGQPKGAALSHANMVSNALASRELFHADAEEPDTYLCVLPLFHSFGQTVIQNSAIAHGGTIVMLPRFEAGAALQLMEKEQVTFFAGVPTMYWALLGVLDDSGVDVQAVADRVRVAVSGGAALPVEVHKEFERRFGVTIVEGYGLSETSPVAAFSVFGEPVRPGSIGPAIPGVEMKLIDPAPGEWAEVPEGEIGEIAIKGPNVMKGYHGRPEATAEVLVDGWLRTGDLARRDADGWYHIVDRSKDLIIRGGFNVYPREVEEVLLTHPEVSLVAVLGAPHETLGEEVRAVVVRTPGSTLTEEALREWAREQMAAYKYPRIIEFRDTLPMTATGKILKREL